MRPMHDTLSAVKSASLELDAAVKARDEEIAATFPELDALNEEATKLRASLKSVKQSIADANTGVDIIKAKHAEKIAECEGVLLATRSARKTYLATLPPRKKSEE